MLVDPVYGTNAIRRLCGATVELKHGRNDDEMDGRFLSRLRPSARGLFAALWKLGVLKNVSGVWIGIGALIAVGVGLMVAVANSGRKETTQIDK